MNNEYDDEIIDLENQDNKQNINNNSIKPSNNPSKEQPSLNNKNGSFSLNKNNFFNNDKTTSEKLQSIIGRNIMPNMSHKNEDEAEEKSASEQRKEESDEVKKQAAKKAIEVASGGKINGAVAEAASDMAVKVINKIQDKFKKKMMIIILVFSLILLFIICLFGGATTQDADLGRDTYGYTVGNYDETELIEQLKYYGFCSNEMDCKQKGVYKYLVKLKEIYTEYSQECTTMQNDKPCNVNLNTALIIETMNFGQTSNDEFFNKYIDQNDQESLNIIKNLQKRIENSKKIDEMLDQIKNLALAQTEYVKENCEGRTDYYYQISFNKYISYLKYGSTSTHPNYSGKPVEITNETCVGPKNDVIKTSYSSDTNNQNNASENSTPNSGAGAQYNFDNPSNDGEKIVNFALKYVGNPYKWGGNSLTNGIDCSHFVYQVLKQSIGYDTGYHVSTAWKDYGKKVSSLDAALPGDVLVYNGHVAIYMGNDKRVHAESKRTGIVVNKVSTAKKKIIAIRRMWNS